MAGTPDSSLLGLQPELLLEIVHRLKNTPGWQTDLRRWSCVSSRFRSVLAPYVFSMVTLRNTEKSGASVDYISKCNQRHHVRELYFQGTAPGDTEDGYSDTENVLPKGVESVLSDLSRFPNLESVCIQFPIDFGVGWSDPLDLFQRQESPEERLRAEQVQGWRALNTRVYAALAENVNPSFKKLELAELMPAEPSSFRTIEFQSLLGQMTHFSLSMWTHEAEFYATNTRPGYLYYTTKFGELFFSHLTSLTHLSITANDFPMGLSGSRHASLDLSPSQMPLLKRIELDTIFIDPRLRDFLVSHAQTLESLALGYCHAGTWRENDSIRWDELFTALAEQDPQRLRELEVWPNRDASLPCSDENTQAELEEAAKAFEYLELHPERKLFSYSYLDEEYGTLTDDEVANLESFRLGNDQRAYDELMRIVKRNAVTK